MFSKIVYKLKLTPRLSLLIPFLVFGLLFIFLPVLFIAIKAFTPLVQDTINDGKIISQTFDNYSIIRSNDFWVIIGRSVLVGLVTAFFSVIIGLPFAFLVARNKSFALRTIFFSLIVSPMFILTLVKILSIRGLFTYIIDEVNLNNTGFLIFGLVYLYLPYTIITLYSLFRAMPANIIKASYDLGANHLITFFKVIIPYALKGALSSFALIFLLSATSIGVSQKLLPDPSQQLLVGNLIDSFATVSNPFKVASVSNVVIITLIVMSSVYVLVYLLPIKIIKRKGYIYD